MHLGLIHMVWQVWVKRRIQRPENAQRYPHLNDLEEYNRSACSR